MKEYLSSISESVVVYRLQISPAAMNALNAASTVCQGRPCLLFARDANVVNVLCQIPEVSYPPTFYFDLVHVHFTIILF